MLGLSGVAGLGFIKQGAKQTTNAAATTILSIATKTNKGIGLLVTVKAEKSDGSLVAHFVRYLTYKNIAGTLTFVSDGGYFTSAHEELDGTSWEINTVINGSLIDIKGIGQVGTIINWKARVAIIL